MNIQLVSLFNSMEDFHIMRKLSFHYCWPDYYNVITTKMMIPESGTVTTGGNVFIFFYVNIIELYTSRDIRWLNAFMLPYDNSFTGFLIKKTEPEHYFLPEDIVLL